MKKIIVKDFLNYVAIFVIFTGAWSYNYGSFAELRASYFIITAVFMLWLPFLKGIHFNRVFLSFFTVMIIVSFYNLFFGNNTLPLLLKQVVGVLQSAVFFYVLVKINNYDVKKLFKIYLNIALAIALIGLFQEICFLLKFRPGYDYSWLFPQWTLASFTTDRFLRISSILPEPAHFCNVMMPAVFVSIASFFRNTFYLQKRWKSVAIIASFFLAFSSGGYLAVFFSIFLLLYNYRRIQYILIFIVLAWFLAFFLYNNDTIFKEKFDDSLAALKGEVRLETTNLSTFAIFSNLDVTYNSLKNNLFFGSGLGSHWVSYDKYILQRPQSPVGIALLAYHSVLCRGDAGSICLRLLSETGVFGFLVFLIFIIKFHVSKKSDRTGYLWVISNAVLSMFFIKLLRMGHYFIDGFLFFIWVYYFAKLKALKDDKGRLLLNEQSS